MAKAAKKLSDLQKAVIDHTAVGYQLIHIQTMEELRALSQLQEVATTLQQAKATPTMTAAWLAETTFPMVTWDRINGYRLHLRSHDMTEEQMMETFGHVPDVADLPRLTETASKVQLMANPSAAIAELLAPPASGHEGSILQNTNAGVYVFLDLDQWFDNSAIGQRLERQLFEAAQYRQLNHVEAQRLVVILSTENKLSQRLRRMSANLRMELPDEHGMATVLDQMLTGMSTVEYADSELRSELTRAMLGLGSLEAENAAALAVNSGVSRDKAGQPFVRVTREAIPRIHDAKAELIQQGGVLEYVPTKDLPKREDIGGYKGLLQAVDEWRVAMSPASRELGVTPPRGMALLGLPGTGKSTVASSLAGMFELPLYKLDIGAVMSKYVGDTEARIRQALEQVDSQRGAVVLLDEIDKTLSSAHEASGDSGASSRVLSYLLTWMATQNSGAFTVMTLNRISTIAPEILRAGRVDAVFFTELPTPEQRTEIFKIHMRKAKIDSTVYGPSDWAKLLEESDKLTGGEIETMVKTAQYRALAVSGTLQPALDHYTLARTRITPVAELNAEQVDNMRKACKGAISVNEALAVPQARAGRAARRLSGNNLNTN